MDCILMRHGIAIDAEAWDGDDKTRPLTGQGKRKLREAVRGLAAMGLSPTHILSSPLSRAWETAKLVRASIGSSLNIVECKELAPENSPAALTTFLAGFPSGALVLCVGHEPLLGETASFWLTGRVLKSFHIKKAGAIHLHFDQKVAGGKGILRWCCQPAQLRLLGMQKRVDRKKQ